MKHEILYKNIGNISEKVTQTYIVFTYEVSK